MAGLVTGGRVKTYNVNPKHLTALLSKLKEIGAEMIINDNDITVAFTGELKSAEVSTIWYPGFPTDLQPQITTLLCKAEGTSVVKETIYEDRFSHVQELIRMGADITLNGNLAIIKGISALSGAAVRGGDLRATAGLIMAALVAEGVSEISGLNHLDRGYYKFSEKLASLGAEINRVD